MKTFRQTNVFWKRFPSALAALLLLSALAGQVVSDDLTPVHAVRATVHHPPGEQTPPSEQPLGYCNHCRRHVCCEKVCVLHCDEKEVEVTCWGCKCEDICIPGKGCRTCKRSTPVCYDENCQDEPCDQCGQCETCQTAEKQDQIVANPKSVVWWQYCPGCPKKIRTRKVLMKKTVKVKTPVYNWVVEEVCHECIHHCQTAQELPGAQNPTPPGAVIPPPPPGYTAIVPAASLNRRPREQLRK